MRTDEYPYGLPTLSPADSELVLGDATLMFRFWSLLMVAEEVCDHVAPPTQFFMEQPEDPANYRSPADVNDMGTSQCSGPKNGKLLQTSTTFFSTTLTNTQWVTQKGNPHALPPMS